MYKELLPKYDLVYNFVKQYNPTSVIDWGCANGNLLSRLAQDFGLTELQGFDPNNAKYNTVPMGSYDCMVSCDVIEHFEPDQLDDTLRLMQTKFQTAAFLIIACYPAKKHLADGRNAHLTVENCAWWLHKIQTHFDQCQVVWWQAVDYPSRSGFKPELRLILERN